MSAVGKRLGWSLTALACWLSYHVHLYIYYNFPYCCWCFFRHLSFQPEPPSAKPSSRQSQLLEFTSESKLRRNPGQEHIAYRGHALSQSFGPCRFSVLAVTDHLKIISHRINNEGGIVCWRVLLADTWWAIAFTASCQRSLMEGSYFGLVFESYRTGRVQLSASLKPENIKVYV